MSPYDQLCQALIVARSDYSSYREQSFNFALKLGGGLKDFLSGPEGSLRFVPLDKQDDNNKGYTVMGAMHMAEDGFWHLGVILHLEDPAHAAHEIKLHLRFRRKEDVFLVLPFEDHEAFVVQPDVKDSFNEVYLCVMKAIENHFRNGLSRQLEQSGALRSIGFHAAA